MIIGGRYGLSSKDTNPSQIFAVFANLEKGEQALDSFTVGINDDVTHLSLPLTNHTDVTGEGVSQLIFYGLGSDGTVGANKNTIKLIGDNTDYYAQAYFAYDSKNRAVSPIAIYDLDAIRFARLIWLRKPISFRARWILMLRSMTCCEN